MKTPIQIASLSQEIEQLNAQNSELSEKVLTLQQQLDWFKRQLFGRKSEKLLVDNPHQDSLFERSDATTPEPQGKQLISYTRSTKKRTGNEVNDTGL